MKIYEYQAMQLFDRYGIDTVPAKMVENPEDVAAVARELGGKVVVKAQVLVGGRGKAGGIRVASSPEKARELTQEILSMRIKDIPVDRVSIAQAIDIVKEYYMGITVDRTSKKLVIMMSSSGGVDIEDLAKNEPEKIQMVYVNPLDGLDDVALSDAISKVYATERLRQQALETMKKLYRLFLEKDCSLVEINPFAQTDSDALLAADAKINFDDNAIYKHPDVAELRNQEEYSEDEIIAKEHNLSFVSMDGDVGCIVNGAGLAMATMDVIKLHGGEPANFLDVGGSSNPDKVLNALKIILGNTKVRAILINIFGGITRCDDIANGIILATRQIDINVPLVIRLIGTNEKEGREILKNAGFVAEEKMTAAVGKVVEEAKQGQK
jgi:succinyl-CoA synthetase beta subunit